MHRREGDATVAVGHLVLAHRLHHLGSHSLVSVGIEGQGIAGLGGGGSSAPILEHLLHAAVYGLAGADGRGPIAGVEGQQHGIACIGLYLAVAVVQGIEGHLVCIGAVGGVALQAQQSYAPRHLHGGPERGVVAPRAPAEAAVGGAQPLQGGQRRIGRGLDAAGVEY